MAPGGNGAAAIGGDDVITSPLPSQQSAHLLIHGEPLAIPLVLAHAAGRGALIFIGGLVLGARGQNLTRAAVGGAIAIELMVLVHELTGAVQQ
jgi:hypothetical protein